MSDPQILDIAGRRYALVPIADWRRMNRGAERLSDEALYDLAKARAGESFPASILDAVLAGETPVAVFRRHRGLTQAALARRAGTNRLYLSQIERGARTGSLALLGRLAKALNVDRELLLPPFEASSPRGAAPSVPAPPARPRGRSRAGGGRPSPRPSA